MSRAVLASALVGCYLTTACAALGPKANVSVVNAEIKSTKNVANIIIPDVTGIDATGNTGKALLGTALKAYGKRSRPIGATSAVLSTIGAPDGLSTILTASYTAEFIKAINAADKKKPEQLKLPAFPKVEVPAGLDGVKTMIPKLTAEAAAIAEIGKSISSGDNEGLTASLDKSKPMMGMVQKMNEYLFAELDVTYVLMTHVVGSEEDWNAGKNVRYCASLVNVKTGKMRYFATVEAKKGAIPMPYMAQLGVMSSNLFDSVEEQDVLPAKKDSKKDAKKDAKKAKASAGLDINVTYY